jgi:CSLREA domain-containing protein
VALAVGTNLAIPWDAAAALWTPSGPPGGVVFALAANPVTPSTLYAGTNRGVFQSTDAGAHWTAVNTGRTYPEVYALAINPATPSTLYAGGIGGVYQSTDAGAHWTLILPAYRVLALAIDPATPDTLYAGAGSEVTKSTNGGASWTSAVYTGGEVTAVAINPATPTTLYAGTDGGGVYQSTDAGAHWTVVNTGLINTGVRALAIDPVTPSTLYAGTFGDGVYSGLSQSTDAGAHWTAINTGLTNATINGLAINPATPSTLYAATNGYGVYESTTGGASWTVVNTGLANTTINALAINPATPSTLYAGTSGGVFQSTTGGASWTDVGPPVADVRALAINPATPDTLYAGTNGGGVFESTTDGTSWTGVNTGLTDPEVFALAIDPATPSTLYAGTFGNGVTYSGMFKSTDAGAHWTAINTGLQPFQFYSLAINPATPSTLYTGTFGYGVFQSTTGGASWTAVSTGVGSPYGYVPALAIDPTTPSTLYAGTNGGGVYKSTDAGAHWTGVDTGLTSLFVTSLVINPTNPNMLAVGTAGAGVFSSTTQGAAWSPINTGLKDLNIFALAYDPPGRTLYAGTDEGVFVLNPSQTNWTALSDGVTSVQQVRALAVDSVHPGRVYAATQTGGVFFAEDGFQVTSVVDAIDAVPGDGLCATAGGVCTLRAAIQEANSRPGAKYILLPAGTYRLTIPGQGEDQAATGDFDITEDLSIIGAGPASTIIDGGGLDRVFDAPAGNTNVTIAGVTIQNGDVGAQDGGGVRGGGSLTLTNSVVRNNHAGSGGGIDAIGSVTVNACTIASNTSRSDGGGIAYLGSLTIGDSTVSSNGAQGQAGGIFASGQLDANNMTLVGNVGHGGGLTSGHVSNSILANNMNPSGQAQDCVSLDSGGYNLIKTTTGCTISGTTTGNVTGVDPTLGPLVNNGGPTSTAALLAGSPAIAAGNPATPGSGGGACTATDQRGASRPGGRCDIGAYQGGCGNGFLDPGEQCDYGADEPSGCERNCTIVPQSVNNPTVPPGGTVVTTGFLPPFGTGATPSNPLFVGVTTPTGGAVTITQNAVSPSAPGGYQALGAVVTIDAPPATSAAHPLTLVFEFLGAILPPSQTASTLDIFKNGVAVPACSPPDSTASPDPCVAQRQTQSNGNVRLTILTTTASDWNGAVAQVCGVVPLLGCAPALSRKSSVVLKPGKTPKAASLVWKWIGSAAVAAGNFGDPTTTSTYALCVLDHVSGAPISELGASVPAGGTCGTKPCWSASPTEFKYTSKTLSPSGVQSLVLKAGAAAKGSITFKSKGSLLAVPALPFKPPALVQLVDTHTGRCWEAQYSTPLVNSPTEFHGASD